MTRRRVHWTYVAQELTHKRLLETQNQDATRSRFSWVDVGIVAGVKRKSQSQVSRWNNGEETPTDDQIRRVVDHYELHIAPWRLQLGVVAACMPDLVQAINNSPETGKGDTRYLATDALPIPSEVDIHILKKVIPRRAEGMAAAHIATIVDQCAAECDAIPYLDLGMERQVVFARLSDKGLVFEEYEQRGQAPSKLARLKPSEPTHLDGVLRYRRLLVAEWAHALYLVECFLAEGRQKNGK